MLTRTLVWIIVSDVSCKRQALLPLFQPLAVDDVSLLVLVPPYLPLKGISLA